MTHLFIILSFVLASVVRADDLPECGGLFLKKAQVGDVLLQAAPDQLILQGHLDSFFEAGMSELRRTLSTAAATERLFARYMDHIWFLEDGDQVVIQNADGTVLTSGYFYQDHVPDIAEKFGHKVPVIRNKPSLYQDPAKTEMVMKTSDLVGLIKSQAQAVVRHNLSAIDKERVLTRLIPQYQKHLEHQQDPERFIEIARETTYELAPYEAVSEGVPEMKIRLEEQGALIELAFLKHDETVALEGGDRVFFVDDHDTLLGEHILKMSTPPFGLIRTTPEQAHGLDKAVRLIVIRNLRP